jgi:hypothetical protein
MKLDEALPLLDQIDRGGPGAYGPNGETSAELMQEVMHEPGAAQTLVERYGSSDNADTVNNIAFTLSDLADAKTSESINLIYDLLKSSRHWDDSGIVNLSLLTIRTQAINEMAWAPPEPTPPDLGRFLVHALGMEPDDINDNADTATNVLWNLHLWAEDRGGLRAIFSAEERQAFRDKFDEVGLEPKPILEALGED